MQKVEAIIQPFQLDSVQQALSDEGVLGMTLSEVRGFGQQAGHTEQYRGTELVVERVPKIKLELVVHEDRVPRILDVLRETANSGRVGDGKIFTSVVESACRIRTGEIGEAALS